MKKVNFADYYAYTQQKAEQEKEERRKKAFEELDHMKEQREKNKQDIADLFKRVLIGSEE